MPPGRVSVFRVRESAAGPGQRLQGQGECRRAGSASSGSGRVPPGRVSVFRVRESAAGPGQRLEGQGECRRAGSAS